MPSKSPRLEIRKAALCLDGFAVVPCSRVELQREEIQAVESLFVVFRPQLLDFVLSQVLQCRSCNW